MAGSLRVIATRLGYYGDVRRYPANSNKPNAGQPFTLKDEKHFSEKWMKWADGGPTGKAAKPAEPAPETPKTDPAPGTAAAVKASLKSEGSEPAPSGARASDQSAI